MGGCQPWCCERHPCRASACPNTFPLIDPLSPALQVSVLQPTGSHLQALTSPPTMAGAESQPYAPPIAPVSAEPPPQASSLPQQIPPPPPVAALSSEQLCPSPTTPTPPEPPLPPAPSAPPPTQLEGPEQERTTSVPPQSPHVYAGEGSSAPPEQGQQEGSGQAPYIGEYPPPGYRPYGGGDADDRLRRGRARRAYYDPYEDLGRYRESGVRPTNYNDRECIQLRSEMGRRRCHHYYPNDYRSNNMPRYPVIDRRAGADFNDVPPPPRSQGERYREMDYWPIDDDDDDDDDGEDLNDVPFQRWNSCPMREPPSSGHDGGEREVNGDRGPGTLVRDNIIIGDPRGVRIGEGNRGGRRTGGRVTGNVVIR